MLLVFYCTWTVFVSLHANMLRSAYCQSPDAHRKKWNIIPCTWQTDASCENVTINTKSAHHECYFVRMQSLKYYHWLFFTSLAVGGAEKHNAHTHVSTSLFTGWELKVEKTTESRIPLWPPKQCRSAPLAAVYYCEITGGEIWAHFSST